MAANRGIVIFDVPSTAFPALHDIIQASPSDRGAHPKFLGFSSDGAKFGFWLPKASVELRKVAVAHAMTFGFNVYSLIGKSAGAVNTSPGYEQVATMLPALVRDDSLALCLHAAPSRAATRTSTRTSTKTLTLTAHDPNDVKFSDVVKRTLSDKRFSDSERRQNRAVDEQHRVSILKLTRDPATSSSSPIDPALLASTASPTRSVSAPFLHSVTLLHNFANMDITLSAKSIPTSSQPCPRWPRSK